MENKAEQVFIQDGHEGKTSPAYKNGFIVGFNRAEELQKEKEESEIQSRR